MIALLTIAVLSLMVPLRYQTSFALIRPFEFIVALALLGWPLIAARRGVRIPTGFLLLLPYFFWYVISSFTAGAALGAREAVQVIVVTAFAFLLAQEAPRLDARRISRRLLWGMAAIAAGTIVWHISHGYLVGWKRITDPRLTYVFIPTVLAGLILFTEQHRRGKLWLVWIGLFPLLVMSGERKALVAYLILTAVLKARGRLALLVPAAAACFAVLFVTAALVSNPYLHRQIDSVVDPARTADYQYTLATGQYRPGDTPSDVARAFSFHVSLRLFEEHPLFGVGTNQYNTYVDREYPNAPAALRIGIHGEFQRVLTENGLIGFVLYLLIWLLSWRRLRRLLRAAVGESLLTSVQARVLPYIIFVPFALFLGTEAPGTRAFVGIIVVSLFPELVRGALVRSPSPAPVVEEPETVFAAPPELSAPVRAS